MNCLKFVTKSMIEEIFGYVPSRGMWKKSRDNKYRPIEKRLCIKSLDSNAVVEQSKHSVDPIKTFLKGEVI